MRFYIEGCETTEVPYTVELLDANGDVSIRVRHKGNGSDQIVATMSREGYLNVWPDTALSLGLPGNGENGGVCVVYK